MFQTGLAFGLLIGALIGICVIGTAVALAEWFQQRRKL